MTNLNKLTKKHIRHLLLTGIGYLVIGIWFIYILFKGIQTDPFIYIFFALIGILLGYITVNYVDPGGSVNLRIFTMRKRTPEDEMINKMIISYKSKLLIIVTFCVIIIFVGTTYFVNYSFPFIFNFNNVVWLLFWSFLTTGLLGTGVKYISAWWNIKRNWKKEFGE